MLNYQLLVEYLLNKIKTLQNNKFSMYLKNLQTLEDVVIIDNTTKPYNQFIIIYDPMDTVTHLYDVHPEYFSEPYYICNNLLEIKEMSDFLLDNLDSIIITIDPDDVLEQI